MRRLVIVGGGSAGWITAAYLNGALNERGRTKTVDITLIESPTIPRITVGEATIPNILKALGVIGIDELDFMKSTDATFKQSIRFVNWRLNDGSSYHHPFSSLRSEPIDTWGREWLASRRDVPFIDTVSDQPKICEMNMAPKMFGEWKFGPPYQYAYHMNALKFADYLRDFSTARGVSHILANITDVGLRENGYIDHVALDNEQDISGDIFIDCTGFQSLLLGKALGVAWQDFSQYLLCNQAVVAHFPYEEYYPGAVRPYTTATALSAGWVWDIPMQTRRSLGYVHSSDFIGEQDAVSELLAYQGTAPGSVDTRLVKFRVGQRRKAWHKNCIAIGLSGGFIEPLESTGLYLCDEAAAILAEYFPYKDENIDILSYRYNRHISNRYYEILDFINMHYCLTKRTDTSFWKEVQKDERINDRLKAKLEFWKVKEPSRLDFSDQHFLGFKPDATGPIEVDPRPPVDTGRLWHYDSYRAVLYGMQYNGFDPVLGPLERRPPTAVSDVIRERVKYAPQALAPHDEWLKKILGMNDWPSAGRPSGWT